jgi:hypothetical protein
MEKQLSKGSKSIFWGVQKSYDKNFNITKKNKNIDKRFEFLANPKKTEKPEKTVDQQLDEQIEKILREKEKTQKRYSKLLN